MEKSELKKNDKLHIPISTKDKERVIKKAGELGLSLSDYCRIVLLNSLGGEIIIRPK